MKKRFFASILVLSILLISCEDNFSPFGSYNEKYVLTCILNSDTTFQTATLSSSYFTGTFNPDDKVEDRSIKFADIRVWYEDSVYLFKDTMVVETDALNNSSVKNFYFNDRFKIAFNKPIEIEVLLENGKRLKAKSQTPKDIAFKSNSSVLIPPVSGNLINIFWTNGNNSSFYQPKLFFKYSKKVNDVVTFYEAEIPYYFTSINGSEKAVYPPASNKLSIVYNMDVIAKTLNNLSKDEPENVTISVYEKLYFTLSILDQNLSRYASSTSKSFNALTVRVNENEYTNIEGGLGIFGSYINKIYDRLRFQSTYIESFGYNYVFQN
ncbi:MAG TPA: hypothetical protein VK870_09970 [Ignavibacteriaceae bacterium]|nr:hypothetical protein [Ignavibacteriaceae bacterium]